MDLIWRVANPDDAEDFASWCGENPDIPWCDIDATHDETTITLAFESNDRVVSYLPFYFLEDGSIRIAFINFSPTLTLRGKARVLNFMLEVISGLALESKADRVSTLTKEGYGIAEWAKKKGFIPGVFEGPRQVFSLGVTHVF